MRPSKAARIPSRTRHRPPQTIARPPELTIPPNAGRWSAQEHTRFVEGLEKHGRRKWIRIAEHVGTRTVIQVRSHAQKYFKKLRRGAPPARKLTLDDDSSVARAAAPPVDARPQLALLMAAAELLENAAAPEPRKRARSDDTDDSVRACSSVSPSCSSGALNVIGCDDNSPTAPPRALMTGPVVSAPDLPELAKRRKIDDDEGAPQAAPPSTTMLFSPQSGTWSVAA